MQVELRHRRVVANGIKQHYVEAGSGPPVVLLHGFPFTWYSWRHQIPVLAERYRLIVPDLRGYGATEKAVNGYDKRTMANDIRALMTELGIDKAAIIGHDRGARVGLRFVKDHPQATARFAALDNVPTRLIMEHLNARSAQTGWFIFFNGVRDLSEALVTGREEIWFRGIIDSWIYDPETYSEEDVATYVRAFAQPGGLRGAFEDYRAWPEDVAQDQVDKDTKIACPTLALWGRDFDQAKMVDMAAIWREFADDLSLVPIAYSGHMPQEEQPDAVNKALLEFLAPWQG
jgi:haloacetate dehalogenase